MTEIRPTPPGRRDGTVPDGTYAVDPAACALRFRAKAFTLLWVRGTMPVVAGTLHVRGGRLSGEGAVAADRVATGVGARDWHLRSSHYLHTKRYPQITLSATDADLGSDTVDCTVTVRGTSRSVPMAITTSHCEGDRLHIAASTRLDRTVFPMLPPLAGVSRMVDIELTVVAHRT
ncbi:YceI family protein [Pseudonocardia sp. NPDC049635]|uniref:YceI family protein n=1 Tax=Pseudonocardia sp. NPDC049635 TaxID=3155506 RepID=UPI0033F123AA